MISCPSLLGILRRLGRRTLLLAVLLAFTLSCALAQNGIDTISSWNGATYISSFGVTDTATYGQVIQVGAGASALNSFTFEIGNCGANVTMRGEVYAWDGTKATGSAIWESAAYTLPASASYAAVTFTPGGITLPAGSYVLFASTSRDQTGAPSSACRWGALPTNLPIPGGSFVFMNNGANPGNWTVSNWNTISQDLAMRVDGLAVAASGVPAASPTSITIGVASLIAMGLFGLYQRRRIV
jgi:hypothetical protein